MTEKPPPSRGALATIGGALRALATWARAHPWLSLSILVVILALQAFVLLFGVVAERNGWRAAFTDRVRGLLSAPQTDQPLTWQDAPLNQHTLQWIKIRIGTERRGGAIAEIGDRILIASPQGHFAQMDANYQLAPVDLRAPMNLDALFESPLMRDPLFEIHGVRVHDLIARERSGSWELYATMSRYVSDNCFQFVLARATLDASGPVLRPTSEWEDLYIARPGCIRLKDRSWRFVGEQASGRMQFLSERQLLISIGDHQFDGFNDAEIAPMNPDWDLGKLIAFDLEARRARVYATGFRNPQGLAILADGRILETEHGPQGGDEINLIREGANYGWPLVTYGMNYGYPRRVWASDPTPGGHGGFARPIYAFVPSVGINNVIQPSPAAFPLWGEDDLLIASLRAQTLFHVRLDGDRVAYAEPLQFPGERLRDIINLSDGRIAILSDSGHLILMRNAEQSEDPPRPIIVSGYETLVQDRGFASDATPEERGAQIFQVACASCHSLNGEVGAGPPLNGVVGRRIGSVEGFAYSQALAGRDGVWTERTMTQLMLDPQRHFPGTTMPQAAVSWTLAPDIVAFLRTKREN
jgi:aldose sugar dehydrogenase